MNEVIDYVARSKIDSHERACVDREKNTDRRFDEVKDEVREVKGEVREVRQLIEARRTVIWTIAGGAFISAVSGVFQLLRPLFHL